MLDDIIRDNLQIIMESIVLIENRFLEINPNVAKVEDAPDLRRKG
jgi:hypothetical protein